MPDTVSLVMGEEQYNIPTVLCRKHQQEGQEEFWVISKDAFADGKRWQRRSGRRPAFTGQGITPLRRSETKNILPGG